MNKKYLRRHPIKPYIYVLSLTRRVPSKSYRILPIGLNSYCCHPLTSSVDFIHIFTFMIPSRCLFCSLRPAARIASVQSPTRLASPSIASSRARTQLPRSTTPGILRRQFSSTAILSSGSGSSSQSHPPGNKKSGDSSSSRHTMAQEQVSDYLEQSHEKLFDFNRSWAEAKRKEDPDYFVTLSAGQKPEYLWIGCSDSRIPAEQITGLQPGQAFVHRNIANLVPNIDLNVMSVINYAVRHLGVKHIIVCGHYGCGGVKAAMTPKDLGLLNPWLRNIRDVYRFHEAELDAITDEEQRYNRLVELNVVEQCRNVIKTAAVQQSYSKNQYPVVHGWVFNFHDGLLTDLKVDHAAMLKNIQKIYNLTEEDS